jgi:hypothetical protein
MAAGGTLKRHPRNNNWKRRRIRIGDRCRPARPQDICDESGGHDRDPGKYAKRRDQRAKAALPWRQVARRPFSGGKGSRHSKAGSPANRNTEYATAGRHERTADPVSRAGRQDPRETLTLSQRTGGQPGINLQKIALVDRRGDWWNGRAIAPCFWQP